jgi:hypothetical protein
MIQTYYTNYQRGLVRHYDTIFLKEQDLSIKLGCSVEEFNKVRERMREYAKTTVNSYDQILDWVLSVAGHPLLVSPLDENLYRQLIGDNND